MFLSPKKIGLASSSPRRLSLLRSVGFECINYSPDIVEEKKPGETILEYIARNALEKNQASISYFDRLNIPIIVSADTVVCIKKSGQNILLEKPTDKAEAKSMLQSLSGREHSVYTAYCISDRRAQKYLSSTLETLVHFRKLGDTEIDSYIETKEPFDKAGAYGAQGYGSVFIEKFEGSYTNVVGLPLTAVWQDWQRLTKSC